MMPKLATHVCTFSIRSIDMGIGKKFTSLRISFVIAPGIGSSCPRVCTSALCDHHVLPRPECPLLQGLLTLSIATPKHIIVVAANLLFVKMFLQLIRLFVGFLYGVVPAIAIELLVGLVILGSHREPLSARKNQVLILFRIM
jgi:hypothetical protein